MTHYDTLNLKPNATEKEIKASFRKLAAKYHPDKNNGDKKAEEMFKKINEAYQTLSNPTEKKLYDDLLNRKKYTGETYSANGSHTSTGHPDIDEILREAFRNQRQRGNNFSGEEDAFFKSFYDTFNFKNKTTEKPAVNLNLTFWEAALGCKKTVIIPEQIIKGNVKSNIKIEPGTEDGSILKVKVKGVEFDLHIKIKNDTNANFQRDGLNLYTSVDVPLVTALLGGKIVFPHWTKDIEVTIPEGSKNGKKMRLKELGIKKGNECGHLFLTINIIMPEKLTDKQKSLLKEFQKIEDSKSK